MNDSTLKPRWQALEVALGTRVIEGLFSDFLTRLEAQEIDMNLAERLQLFPGGLTGLAAAAGVAKTVVYRFAWREHKKPPVALAEKIALAIRSQRRDQPLLRELGDLETLLELWKGSERSRLRDGSPVANDGEAHQAQKGEA